MLYDINWFKGKRVTVMGLGLHGGGLGVAKWLLRHGARLTLTDLKDKKALEKTILKLEKEYKYLKKDSLTKTRIYRPKYILGLHEPSDFSGAEMIIRNPAAPNEHPLLRLAKKNKVPIESDISLFFLICPFPITGITGTKGKTTTTALLSEICKLHDKRTVIGGNIRISPMDSLDGLLKLAEKESVVPPPIVLELSSWQLESLEKHKISPRVAVVTNIMRDHLNRYHGKISEYAAAKELIVRFQKDGDLAIMNTDDRRVEAMAKRLEKKKDGPFVLRFSSDAQNKKLGCFLEKGNIIAVTGDNKKKIIVPLSAIKIPGEHNIMNVLASTTAALAMGIPVKTVAAGVKDFRGVYGRLETIITKKGITYINDTTATTPDASRVAVETLAKKFGKRSIILIAGGDDKDLKFREWAKSVTENVKRLILLDGTGTIKMERSLKQSGGRWPDHRCESMAEAVKEARAVAVKGNVIILSPGCASFGMFINEFDRGDQFVKLVSK